MFKQQEYNEVLKWGEHLFYCSYFLLGFWFILFMEYFICLYYDFGEHYSLYTPCVSPLSLKVKWHTELYLAWPGHGSRQSHWVSFSTLSYSKFHSKTMFQKTSCVLIRLQITFLVTSPTLCVSYCMCRKPTHWAQKKVQWIFSQT